MSHTFTCDRCGEVIEDDDGYVTLTAKASSESSWTDGWVAHYHSDNGEESCFRELRSILDLAHGWGQAVDSLPVVDDRPTAHDVEPSVRTEGSGRPDPDEWRRRLAAGTPLYTLDLSPRAVYALQRADLCTLEEVARRTEDEVAAVKYVGGTTMQMLKAALSNARLSFRQVEGVAG